MPSLNSLTNDDLVVLDGCCARLVVVLKPELVFLFPHSLTALASTSVLFQTMVCACLVQEIGNLQNIMQPGVDS